ncbi:HD domain-containing protein [bacterium]|nr:HD domain-containing protein [bacterium]
MNSRLIEVLCQRHFRNGEGLHGISHWKRVESNGLMLAAETGGDVHVIRAFAYLHDAARQNEHVDPEHGERAARLAIELNEEYMGLDRNRLAVLVEACRHHSDMQSHKSRTICTCWDADRLDLVRLGYRIDPGKLATEVAALPDMIEAARARLATMR